MRGKQLRLVITFFTTTDAMAAESLCLEKDLPGRLIPVPREISAGCGMAWMAPTEYEKELCAALDNGGIKKQGAYKVMI